jgi:hypothetical protein
MLKNLLRLEYLHLHSNVLCFLLKTQFHIFQNGCCKQSRSFYCNSGYVVGQRDFSRLRFLLEHLLILGVNRSRDIFFSEISFAIW